MGILLKQEEISKLQNIFFSFDLEQRTRIQEKKIRFVHYTSVEAAINILQTKKVWMLNSSCMNDLSEVKHGLRCLYSSYKKKLKPCLENLFSEINQELAELFDSWTPHFLSQTYLTCVSEHTVDDDRFGRLSMWRAFSKTTGVALVLNNDPFLANSDQIKFYLSPVAYLDDNRFDAELDKVVSNINENKDFLKSLDQEIIKIFLFHMLRFAILSTKHPAFLEEKEWRIIYSPTFENSDDYLENGIETIKGVPQRIYKIPLKNRPDIGLNNMEISDFLNSIIIGPTQYPDVIRDTFIEVLIQLGVDKPDEKVILSNIPLRI